MKDFSSGLGDSERAGSLLSFGGCSSLGNESPVDEVIDMERKGGMGDSQVLGDVRGEGIPLVGHDGEESRFVEGLLVNEGRGGGGGAKKGI